MSGTEDYQRSSTKDLIIFCLKASKNKGPDKKGPGFLKNNNKALVYGGSEGKGHCFSRDISQCWNLLG